MTRGRAFRLAALYAATAGGGALAAWAGVPLAWIIGPILVTFALNMARLAPEVPVRSRPFGQMVVASSVGLGFSSEAFGVVVQSFPVLVGMALLTVLIAVAMTWLMVRTTGTDVTTAFLATCPNGPVEMTSLAHQLGGDAGLVAFCQTTRICLVVLLVPVVVYLLHDGALDPGLGRQAMAGSWDIAGIAMTLAVALVAAGLFRLLRLANPYFLGPLAVFAALSTVGLPLERWPAPVLALAQILLGTWLGSTLGPDLIAKAGRRLLALLTVTLLLIALCCVAALVFLPFGLDPETLILGAAPGGITEMALTAKALRLDVPTITAFHVLRILMVTPNIPWIVRRIARHSPPQPPRTP